MVRQNNMICEAVSCSSKIRGIRSSESVGSIGCGDRAVGTISHGLESRYTFDLEGEVGTIVRIHVFGVLISQKVKKRKSENTEYGPYRQTTQIILF